MERNEAEIEGRADLIAERIRCQANRSPRNDPASNVETPVGNPAGRLLREPYALKLVNVTEDLKTDEYRHGL